MNVKISSGEMRFKITAEELEHLKKGIPLVERLVVGRQKLTLAIDPVGVSDDFIVSYDENTIRLLVSAPKIQALADLGHCREGLEQVTDHLTISLQVDLRTQRRQSA
ncbi:MAG: hypothetical protein CO093_02220 [Alphaproteobacteria bacterium CG_4_9_14_3_um_filter_47_13]|nr:MAG: hypothetical protein CO093_02220 [Alphaproteobacteria bacterium CG_4_9_14_3_um_filter_47_13]